VTTAPKRQPIPFGKYLLLDRVNIGGMAEVWRAKTFGAGGFERLVAIKRILPNIAEDEEFITMFIDEAKITVQLNHANIAQVHELSHIANSYFIAMEYVSGKDMRGVFDRCRKRGEPAPIPLTCYAIALCCEGLDYAHRAKDRQGRDMNIVHRDVSPQNAIISYDGEVKVIDFGIAKAAGKATKTQAGILKGKFGYMSPEQIRGLPLDRRSDVFAIGVCLYEMLTGERLFVGDSDFSVLEKVRKVEVLPPSHFNRKIPEQLEKMVMKALAKDVDDRYQYANELAEDLRTFMYSTGNAFSRKDLAAFMKATFAEDYEKEKNRLQEYADVKAPEGMAAAAEMGFGVGNVPAAPGSVTNASSVTSVPTTAGPAVPAQGLPPMVRSVPTLTPQTSVGQRLPAAGATAIRQPAPVQMNPSTSMPSIPRLTAVAPMLTNGKEEHNSTVLVDGGGQFDDSSTNPGSGADSTRALNVRNLGPGSETATDPARPTIPRTATGGGWDQAQNNRPGPPVLSADPPQRRMTRSNVPTGDTSPTLPPLNYPSPANNPVFSTPTSQHLQPVRSGNKMLIALSAVVVLLVLALGGAVFLRPVAKGHVIVSVPNDVKGKAEVQIDGEVVTEKDGSPLQKWPAVLPVKPGRVTVRVSAPGYDTLLEIVDVKEGEPVELTKQWKKSTN
jgi:serine/threonine protein kinase